VMGRKRARTNASSIRTRVYYDSRQRSPVLHPNLSSFLLSLAVLCVLDGIALKEQLSVKLIAAHSVHLRSTVFQSISSRLTAFSFTVVFPSIATLTSWPVFILSAFYIPHPTCFRVLCAIIALTYFSRSTAFSSIFAFD
jgi:hypothetical protein